MASLVLPIISGIAGLLGGQSQQKTSSSQNSSGTTTTGSSATPTLNSFQQQLAQLFSGGAMDQYNRGTNLAPFTSNGLQQIQGQGSANQKTIANNLASRGLSFSPASQAPLTQNLLNTGNQMSQFQQQVPLLQRQLSQADLSQLIQAFTAQPFGNTQTGDTSFTGQQSGTSAGSTPGAGIAGLFGGLGAGLAAPGSTTGNTQNSVLTDILRKFGLN